MATTYVVKSGDTLSAIAAKYSVKGGYQALASYNGISNPNKLSVGQKLQIPDSGSSNKTSGQTSANSSSTTSAGAVKVTASALNVRKGPGTGYGIWGTLSKGKQVSFSEEKNGWLKISYNGKEGWISKQYTSKVTDSTPKPETKPETTTKPETEATSTKTMYVTANSLNVRKGPGTNYSVVGSLKSGKEVAVISTSNGWAKINFNSGTAYVSADYLSASNPYDFSNVSTEGVFNLTPEKLDKVASGAKKYYSELVGSMAVADITTKLRACGYVAQLAHESGNFYYMEEIASGAAYEGRTDLGNTQPGDGKRYKGRGPIQITGRYNYTQASKDLGIDLVNHPEWASKPEIGFKLSAWFWKRNNINRYCDNDDIVGMTKVINGGTNGLADRKAYYAKAKKHF